MFVNNAWQIIGNKVWSCILRVGTKKTSELFLGKTLAGHEMTQTLYSVRSRTSVQLLRLALWQVGSHSSGSCPWQLHAGRLKNCLPTLISFLNLSKCIPSLPGPWGLTWCHSVNRNTYPCLFVLKEILDHRFSACVPRNQDLDQYKLELRQSKHFIVTWKLIN
jgi:hypothetical protein